MDLELEHVPQEVIERPMEEYLKGWISDTRCKGHSNRSNVLASETRMDGFWEASKVGLIQFRPIPRGHLPAKA